MTALDLDAVEARARAATAGPWTTDWVDAIPLANHNVVHNSADVAVCTGWGPANEAVSGGATNAEAFALADRYGRADAEFIAHARTDVPALLDELSDTRARVRALEAAEARVREVHIWEPSRLTPDEGRCNPCFRTWPCPTIAALDGTDAS